MAQNEAASDEDDGVEHRSSLLDRREYLKLASAAVATVGGLGATSTGAAAASGTDIVDAGADPNGNERIDGVLDDLAGSGETIYFPPGEYLLGDFSSSADNLTLNGEDATLVAADDGGRIFNMSGDNWTFNGFEFDFSTTDRHPTVQMSGRGWEFKNVVFRGTDSSRDAALLYPDVPDGATGRIQNCYLHEGNADSDEAQGGKAMWSNDVYGELVIDGIWCEMWAENTLYLSECPGRITIKNSYFRNTNVGVRVTEPASFENCVFVHDGVQPAQLRDDGRVTGRAQRGVWWNAEKGSFNGQVTVSNCDFYYVENEGAGPLVDATDGRGSTLLIEDTNIHNETGQTIVWSENHNVEARNVSITGNKEFSVSDWGTRDINSDRKASSEPPIPEPPAEGTTPNTDSSSTETSDSTDSTSTDSTDSTDDTSDDTTDSTQTLPNTMTIKGTGTVTNYEFTVSDSLRANSDKGALEEWDSIDGTTATGWVTETSQLDGYQFAGDVTDFTFVEGEATVMINGTEVAPSSLGSDSTDSTDSTDDTSDSTDSTDSTDDTSDSTDSTDSTDDTSDSSPSKTVTITGEGTPTHYRFTVSDTLEEAGGTGSLEEWDTISGTEADGWVTTSEQVDSYKYSGELTSFEFLSGDARVTVNGEPLAPDSLDEESTESSDSGSESESRTISITGTGTPANYEFTVSDTLDTTSGEGALEEWDTVSGTTATGWVTEPSQVDTFEFTGSVTDFGFKQGSADVAIDGERVDPDTLG